MNVFKAANSLYNTKTETTTTPATTTPEKYEVTECFNVLKNLWAEPKYTQLIIERHAYAKLVSFIHLVGAYEITGFGRIQEQEWTITNEQGVPETKTMATITDFDIIKQEVKSAYVEADDDAVMDFLRKLPEEQRGEWVLDWHSHVEMGVTPSGTDWSNYEAMLKARLGNQFPAIIVNKQGSINAVQYMSESKHPDIEMLIDKGFISEDDLFNIYKECKIKVENLCTKYVAKATTYQYSSWFKQDSKKAETDSDVGYGYGWGYGYGSNYGYGDFDDDWDTPPKKKPESIEDEEDEEVIAAKKAGFVFDDETDDGTEPPETGFLCQECGKPLDPNNQEEQAWGVCSSCLGIMLPTEKKEN